MSINIVYVFRYYEYLELANEGDVRPFYRFITECTENILDTFLWATQEYISTIPALENDSKITDLQALNINTTNFNKTSKTYFLQVYFF